MDDTTVTITSSNAASADNTSGQGAASVIPPELNRWNWGAFFLNWIWGIGNDTYIALLMFVPGANLVMPFVLGAKGSAWAWRNRRWRDAEHFRRVQRNWAIWGVVVFVAILGVIAASIFSVTVGLKNSEPYQMAVARLQASSEAMNALGTPISTGFPSGKIETSGSTGTADLSFSVEGPSAKGTVYLDATKDFGTWKINRIELQIEGRAGRINLADEAARQNVGTGLAAAKRGDFATALRLWRPLAEQGDAAAQANLGIMYANGHGVAQDFAEAVTWFRKAADQGLADAQNSLGALYARGRGVPQDYAEAAKWYRRAADQGLADAQNSLGVMYARGQGVPQDYAEAATWYRRAADQGNSVAQFNMGAIYANGRGVPRDLAEAATWYRLAAEQGDPDAQSALGDMYDDGRGVPQDFAQAVKWYQKAADQGTARAQSNLGVMYAKGHGVEQNFAEAANWYGRAARQGYAIAQFNLAYLYAKGQGVAQNFDEAAKWYRLAAAQGHASAQNNLGVLLMNGQGVAQDYLRACMWLNLAAAKGLAGAERNRDIAAQKLTAEQVAQAREMARTCLASNYKQCD